MSMARSKGSTEGIAGRRAGASEAHPPAGRLSPAEALRASAMAGGCETLADLVLERTRNPFTVVSVLSFIALWGAAYEKTGQSLSTEQLVAASGKAERTVYRWAAKFREHFPELGSPATLWSMVEAPEDIPSDVDRAAFTVGGAHLRASL